MKLSGEEGSFDIRSNVQIIAVAVDFLEILKVIEGFVNEGNADMSTIGKLISACSRGFAVSIKISTQRVSNKAQLLYSLFRKTD